MNRQYSSRTGKRLCLAALCVMTAFSLMSCEQQEPEIMMAELGKKAPNFSLTDLEGNTVNLSDYAGKVVVLDFWATWCHACKHTAPVLERLYQKYQEDDFILLGITMDSDAAKEEKVRAFVQEYDQTYPILWDDGMTSEAYEIIKIPTTFILSRNHIVIDRLTGFSAGFEMKVVAEISKELKKTTP